MTSRAWPNCRTSCTGCTDPPRAAGFLADILGPSLLAAVGLGFAFVPVTIAAVSGVEDR